MPPGGCLNSADFTYFQTFVDVPVGTVITDFRITFSGAIDDGARITIFNSTYPGGLVVPGSYVFLNGSGTTDLSSFVAIGERNRVVVTQVDDCATGNNLEVGRVALNGGVLSTDCDLPVIDVYDSTDPNNFVLLGQIETIRTAGTGAAHYDFDSDSGHPSGVNLAKPHANIWVHQDTGTDDLTFGFIFGKDASGAPLRSSSINFRIVGSGTDPFVSQSDDPGEAVESPAGSNAFIGTYNYVNNTDGIAVSGISGTTWTIIVDSVAFGNVITDWFASNGSVSGFSDDLALTLGNEYRLTPACNPPADVPVTVSNTAPTVDVDDEDVTVDEGETANNTGTFGDADGDDVTLTASAGTVTPGDGTWSWSFDTTDGPER